MAAKKKHDGSQQNNRSQPDPIQAAIDYGIDVQMLRDNLARTPTERVRRHQIALNTVEWLRKARLVE